MTAFRRIASLKPQASGNATRMLVEWEGHTYAINQNTLNGFASEVELKAALDDWTTKTYGYVISDIWFHKNRDGTWAIATGDAPPAIWPEDEPVV